MNLHLRAEFGPHHHEVSINSPTLRNKSRRDSSQAQCAQNINHCCSRQGEQEFNFSQMAFSSSLQPAPVRRGQDAHPVPGCALHRARASRTHKRCTYSIIKSSRRGDLQGKAPSPLLTWEAIPAALQNLEATTPIYTFHPMPQPRVGTCQSQLHLSPGG